jgi:hypothetical protein
VVAVHGKVRIGAKAVPSPNIVAKMHQEWVHVVQPVCGFATYNEMRQANAAETINKTSESRHEIPKCRL